MAVALDLVEVGGDLGGAEIDQPIVARRGFDVAVVAREVAERAGIEPQRLERPQGHVGPRLAFGGGQGILELRRIDRNGEHRWGPA